MHDLLDRVRLDVVAAVLVEKVLFSARDVRIEAEVVEVVLYKKSLVVISNLFI